MSPAEPLVRQVRLRYFAILREHAGTSCEKRETTSTTVEELYVEIKEEKGFDLEKEFIRVACNGDFVELDCSLSDGDEIVFHGSDPTNPDTDADGFTDGADNCVTISNAGVAACDSDMDGYGNAFVAQPVEEVEKHELSPAYWL